MLSLACAIVVLGPSVEFTIPVRHESPSRLVEMMRDSTGHSPLISHTVHMSANDTAHLIRVQGNADEILSVRQFVKLMDVERPMAQIKIHIETLDDPLGFDVTTSVRSNKVWKMSDEETGLTIALNPLLASNGSTVLRLNVEYPGGSCEQTLRLKASEKYVMDLGSKRSITGWQSNTDEIDVTSEEHKLPKLTFQVIRPKSK